MKNKKLVGIFHSIDAVLYEVATLTTKGYSENDFYALSREKDTTSMLTSQAKIKTHWMNSANWIDGFKAIGFESEDAASYYDEIENGGIALFVEDNHENPLIETDSSVELGRSGELLDSQESHELTTPRMNTENL